MIASPSQSAIQTVLRTFLMGVLPAGVPVVAGQINRVAEPLPGDYVVMIPILRGRLAWNIDSYIDCSFTASIAGATMTVTALNTDFQGRLAAGLYIFGTGLTAQTKIIAQLTGTPGGAGTYTVSPSQTIASRTMAAGTAGLMQKTEVVIQCDVHGPASADNAQIIATAIFDDVAQQYFDPATTGVAPLYAADPRQMPFIDGENQFETRWIVDVHLEANINVLFPQQFADAVTVDVVSVDAAYPPT